MTTLAQLYDKLEAHDWYYAMSDDNRYWVAGEASRKELEEIGKESPAHQSLIERYTIYMFSGDAWGTAPEPKPSRPDESVAA